jgi:hypothetical protein
MRNAAKRAQCARAFPMPRERDEEMVVAMAWSAMEREIVSLTLQTEMQGARLVQMDEEVKAMHRKTDEFRRRLLETDCTHREAIEWYTDQTKTLEHRNTLLETHLHETLLARPPAGAEQVKASNVTWCKGEPGEFKHAQKAPTAEAAVGATPTTQPSVKEQLKASNVTWCKGDPWEFAPLSSYPAAAAWEFKPAQKAPTAKPAVGAKLQRQTRASLVSRPARLHPYAVRYVDRFGWPRRRSWFPWHRRA